MPISPRNYVARAAESEQLAASITDETIKQGYLGLAAELRRMGDPPPRPLADQTDQQIEQMVERMVNSSPSKL